MIAGSWIPLADSLHPFDALLQVSTHRLNRVVMNPSVTRQHPLETVSQQLFHRARLFRPRIPADAAEGRKGLTDGRPGEVIAREEILVAVEQNHVAARMARRGDDS